MADQVRMTSRTVFANERITVFAPSGPSEGVKGGTVTVGNTFETDLAHAKELDRLGLAAPDNRADLDGDAPALVAHYQVPEPALRADRAARATIESPTAQPVAEVEPSAPSPSAEPAADATTSSAKARRGT